MVQSSVIERNPALADMSIEEIQELLREKEQAANKEKQRKRKDYEAAKEEMINTLGGFATSLCNQMRDLKLEAFRELAQFRVKMMEYGEIRGKENNKGSFEVKNDHYKIVYKSQVNKNFDERAELAEAKLKEFLSTFVKKKDRAAFDLVSALLERNSAGDFDFDLINRLYKMRDRFDNPLWIDALDMFMESYSPYGTAQYIQFYEKDVTNNAWNPVVLDFAKLKALPNEKKKIQATPSPSETPTTDNLPN